MAEVGEEKSLVDDDVGGVLVVGGVGGALVGVPLSQHVPRHPSSCGSISSSPSSSFPSCPRPCHYH
jgi:hypothetical protein